MSTQRGEGTLSKEVLTVKEVAAYLRVSRVTVWRWCQQGVIPASRIGRNWRICRSNLLDLLETAQPLDSTSLQSSSAYKYNGRTER
jgi:excisionase family DNA binding protein